MIGLLPIKGYLPWYVDGAGPGKPLLVVVVTPPAHELQPDDTTVPPPQGESQQGEVTTVVGWQGQGSLAGPPRNMQSKNLHPAAPESSIPKTAKISSFFISRISSRNSSVSWRKLRHENSTSELTMCKCNDCVFWETWLSPFCPRTR